MNTLECMQNPCHLVIAISSLGEVSPTVLSKIMCALNSAVHSMHKCIMLHNKIAGMCVSYT